MNQPASRAPIQNGHVAEAIAQYFLGGTSQWIGGRNPGYDLILDGVKVDVKSGVRQRNILHRGADPEDTIGIRLNKGVQGLQDQDVDQILVVVRDGYSDSTSNVSMAGDVARVVLSVDVTGVAVYRLLVADVVRLFKQPFKRNGSTRKSIENIDAPTGELDQYRLVPRVSGGDVAEFRHGGTSGGRK